MSGTADHYTTQVQQLLPPGDAFTREPGVLTDLIRGGVATELARVEARGADLVVERDPSTADELLADWEKVLGLPDCSAPTTLSGRRAAVVSKLVGIADQSEPSYVALTVALGYAGGRTHTRPFPPFTAGSPAGDALTNMGNHDGASLDALVRGAGWPYVWYLDVVAIAGEYTLDESDEIDLILECRVSHVNQNHAIVRHLYRLFASDDAGLTSTHAAALDLFDPYTAEALTQVAIDATPAFVFRGIEYLWCYDDGADPVDNELSASPLQMLTRGWWVTVIPTFDSDDTDDHTVFALGDTDGGTLVLVPYDATQMVFRFYASHSADGIDAVNLCAESAPLTFVSSDKLTVTVNGETGEISVVGARAGNGSADDGFLWDLSDAAGVLHIGKDA